MTQQQVMNQRAEPGQPDAPAAGDQLALLEAYNPYTTGSGLNWGYLAILAAWGVAGLIMAVRRFSWLPRGG